MSLLAAHLFPILERRSFDMFQPRVSAIQNRFRATAQEAACVIPGARDARGVITPLQETKMANSIEASVRYL